MKTEKPERDVQKLALDYMASHQVMTLATYGSQGLWAAAVFYVNRGFELVFLSAAHTRHVQNLQENPWASATVQEDYEDWPDIKGIQLEGSVRQLAGKERTGALASYTRKYPFIHSAGQAIQSAMQKVNWYSLSPQRLYFIDNSLGLGHRDEVTLP